MFNRGPAELLAGNGGKMFNAFLASVFCLITILATAPVASAAEETICLGSTCHPQFGVADPIQSTDTGGSGEAPSQIAPSCPEDSDGINDPRRRQPLCGQPRFRCNAPEGAACSQVMPAQKTYPHCAALISDGATLVHFGRCENGRPEPVRHRLHVGFEVSSFRECVHKIRYANKLKPNVATWHQVQASGDQPGEGTGSSDTLHLKPKEFCRRLYPAQSVPVFGSGANTASEDDDDNDDE